MNDVAQTVFVVDDDAQVRVGLTRLLSAAGYQVRAFESAGRFLNEQDAETPGCLLVDVYLPGLSGMELQMALTGLPCARPIIFLTGSGDIQTSVRAMKAGAVDFLTKPIDKARLVAAIDQAFRLDAEQRADRAIRYLIDRRLLTLTPREREVMTQVVRGRLNKQIAADLKTGEKTIKVHRARVMSKMGVRSVPELVQLAARIGIAFEPFRMPPRSLQDGRSPNVLPLAAHGP
jgi:FixJ family two-component response regulator